MKSRRAWFNLILLISVGLGIGGCNSPGKKGSESKLGKKEATSLRFFLEVNPDGTQRNAPVPIYRAQPIYINVEKAPILNEADILKTELVNADIEGGFAIKVQFTAHGSLIFENASTTYRGHRIAIQAIWTEARWLGAPRMSRRVTDGQFIFTPDATREEAERIVHGVNNVSKELQKPFVF